MVVRGLKAAFTPAITVVLTCPGSVRILGICERTYAHITTACEDQHDATQNQADDCMLGFMLVLLMAMEVGGPDSVWGWPRARPVKPLVPPVSPVPPVPSLPPSPPVPLIPSVPQVPPIQPLPPVPPRP